MQSGNPCACAKSIRSQKPLSSILAIQCRDAQAVPGREAENDIRFGAG